MPAQAQTLYSRLLQSGRIDGRAEALSPRSVKYTHAVLRMTLKDAVRLGPVPRNACGAVTLPKAPPPQVKYWGDTAHLGRFLEIAGEDRLSALWVLALHTGLRWVDVDLDRAVLHVRQSLKQSRGAMELGEPELDSGQHTTALDDVCVVALREHRTHQMEQCLKAAPL